jgi:hydroxymethylglutaryl-CoA synthase
MPLEEGGEGLDIRGKKIMLFSYGSGCAASMFIINVKHSFDYQNVIRKSQFKKRLEERVKITPEEFDRWMLQRELSYGKYPYQPSVNYSFVSSLFRVQLIKCTKALIT